MSQRTRLTISIMILSGLMALHVFQAAASTAAPPAAGPVQAQQDFGDAVADAEDESADGEESSDWEEQAETAQDAGESEAAQDEAQDAAGEDAADPGDGWGDASVAQNRTASEKETVSEIENALLAALHTEKANPNLSIQAELGYGGIVTYTKPIPVEATIKNSGGDLNGSVCVNLYRSSSYFDRVEYPLYLPAGAERRIRFNVTLTQKQSLFTIEYREGDSVLASVNVSPSTAVSPDLCLVGVLSDSPAALSYLNISEKNDALLRGEYFQTVPLRVDGFPDTAEALEAFGVLAVDGVDLTALDDAQKAAFDAWLKAGGIALVGGGAQAAADYPFFESYTGVKAGALSASEDVTPALLAAVGQTGEALGQGALLSRLEPGANSIASVAEGSLVDLFRVEEGAVCLSAFELGARPLTDWAGIGSLWQQLLLKSAPDAYTGLFGDGFGGYSDDYYLTDILRDMPIESAATSRALILWLLSGFVAVSGIVMYLVLKKLDRRELLWLTMPVCALIAAFGIFQIGAAGDSSRPIAASCTWAIIDARGQSALDTRIGAATPSRKSVRLSAGSGVTLEPSEQNAFEDKYYDSGTFTKTPSELRYVRTLGAEKSVTLPAQSAWTQSLLTVQNGPSFEGDTPATIWMEDDGLHGHVKNETSYTLTGCAVISSAGYADIGDLAPGQEADFALLYLTDQEADQLKAAQEGNNYDFVPEGRIAGTTPAGVSGYAQVNSIAEAAVQREYRILDSAKRNEARAALSALERETLWSRVQLIRRCMEKWAYNDGFGSSDMFFRFYGFSDRIGAVSLTLDGAAVDRSTHLAVIDKEISYQPVGPTGVVFYPVGQIAPRVADAQDGAPILLEEADSDKYYRLSTNPAFGFVIPDAARLTDLELTIQSRFYDYAPTTALFNAVTGRWDEFATTFTELKGSALAPYLDKDGALCVRYGPGPKSDGYQEIMPPLVSVSGRYRQ